ncbi:MAG: MBL fold metallo-hydrolase RNA specificity domain-containing protein [archaeon]
MEICAVGGYDSVGKNMTAVKVGDDVFIFDMGVSIPALIDLQNDNIKVYSEKHLRKAGAVPDDRILDKLGWAGKVRAIILGHAHLDHIGAVPWIAYRYPKAKILGTHFTIAVLETLLKDAKKHLRNQIIKIHGNSSVKIKGKSGTYNLDFLHVTHSTIQCTNIAFHTKEGVFFYSVDFKFDDTPVISNPPDYNRFKQVGKKGVKVLVLNSLYSKQKGRSLSEMTARKKVEEAINKVKNDDTALFVSTFSSHIERLKSIVDFGKKTNRKIIFLGRSMHKYVDSAIKANNCPFKKDISLAKYRNEVNSVLKEVEENREKYLIVCTGHQAEENSILDRIIKGQTPFKFMPKDNIIFASKVIPVPQNILAREKMDAQLEKIGVKIQKDIHVSGHDCEEDIKMVLDFLKPEHIVPTHGTPEQEFPVIRIAQGIGYEYGKNVYLTKDGKVLKF